SPRPSVPRTRSRVIERDAPAITPALPAFSPASRLDQDAAHGLGGGGEEKPPAVPVRGRREATEPPPARRDRAPDGLGGDRLAPPAHPAASCLDTANRPWPAGSSFSTNQS